MIAKRSGWNGWISWVLIPCLLLPWPLRAEGKLKLSPQQVVDLTLSKGRAVRAAELQAQRSYLGLETARSVFDLTLTSSFGYESDEAESLTGFSNPKDQTSTFAAQLSKKMSSGTTLTLGYDHTRQSSVLSSFTAQTRNPNATENILTFGVRQNLLRNYFGLGDRLAVEAAETSVRVALEGREENLEQVILEVMTLYWDAYVAQQQLKENVAARDKYEQLVKNTRRKSSFNLSTPGELPRLEAEYDGAEARVKASATVYLGAIDRLTTAIQMPTGDDIEFDIPVDLPPVPQLIAKDVDTLRSVRVARASFENTERDLRAVKVNGLPQLDLVASAKSTGVDVGGDAATAEMVSGTKPTYFIGVELSTPLDSGLLRGGIADRTVAVEQGRLTMESSRDTARDTLRAAERTVIADYAIARANIDAVEKRARVVRELESSYRQGRQPLVELIRSYNELFSAQLEKARAVGNYHVSLNRLAAARDELVTNNRN
ncbi:MAG: TolC family protein [Bdellovibrionaceae bacterium]|nr:TolC family protein [Pseudobdellovibrionaceae bacterium]